jgi:succinate dehydrogenase / fumarate reductase cytochrome b subunit
VAAVLYHALNGVKIMLFDFWPKTTRYMKPLSLLSTGIFVLAMIPISWIIIKGTLELVGWL